jgi:hypothetical protein
MNEIPQQFPVREVGCGGGFAARGCMRVDDHQARDAQFSRPVLEGDSLPAASLTRNVMARVVLRANSRCIRARHQHHPSS